MSEENVKLVTRLVEAWNRGDLDAFLALYHPECEVTFPPEVPEPGPFHGRSELRAWTEGFLDAWESHHVDVVGITAEGDQVIAMLRLRGRGAGSGIETDETDAHLLTFRDGKITRWQNFNERSEALEAAGLSE
jgi:ketosteroid isomerase-like protein